MESNQQLSAVQQRRYLLASIALFSIPLSGFSIDIYVPSLPAITHDLATTQALTQLTIAVYALGFGVMQLFSGVVSDSFGRRKPFLCAVLFFIAATFLIPFVHDIYQLLGLRLVQGITIAFLSVPMRAVIADLFEGREFYKMMSYLAMAWAIAPIIAPAIGGYLQHYFGWHAPFYFLGAYASMMLLLNFLFLPETIRHVSPLHLKPILARYAQILMHKEYVLGVVTTGLLYSIFILFSNVCPFLIQTVLHFSPVYFGQIALLMGLAWFIGNMLYRFLINLDRDKTLQTGYWVMIFTVIMMLLATFKSSISVFDIVAPTFMLLLLGGFIFPAYYARNISLFPKFSATANSLSGGISWLITGVCSALGSLLKSDTQLPLGLAYAGIIMICVLIFYFGPKEHD